jgi:hypothetical protein
MKHTNPSSSSEPVGLTVYDLPSPEQAATQDASRTRAGRIRMLLVMAVCAAPIIFSYLTYYVIRPQSASSFGQLIEPQRDIPAITDRSQRADDRLAKFAWPMAVCDGRWWRV